MVKMVGRRGGCQKSTPFVWVTPPTAFKIEFFFANQLNIYHRYAYYLDIDF